MPRKTVTFREIGSATTFALDERDVRRAMRDLRPLLSKDEQGFVESAIRTGFPNPVPVNARAADAVKELSENANAA